MSDTEMLDVTADGSAQDAGHEYNDSIYDRDTLAQVSTTKSVITDLPRCSRQLFYFSCGHAYLAPDPACSLCPYDQHGHPYIARAAASALTHYKITRFRQECHDCQMFTLNLKIEVAKQTHDDGLEIWGEDDEDTSKQSRILQRAKQVRKRVKVTIYRDLPKVEGWQMIDFGRTAKRKLRRDGIYALN